MSEQREGSSGGDGHPCRHPRRAGDGRPPALAEQQFDVHIEDAAARHGVSRELVRAIIQVESGFDRLAWAPL